MDRLVAHGAGLIFLGLVVCRSGEPQGGSPVTLQTQQVDLRDAQKSRIGRAVRRVATHASFGLDRHVLVNEGTLLVGVALVANGVASGRGAHLAQLRGAMHVVTIAALHQAFIYAMAVGTGEVGTGRSMAAVAQIGLGLDEQVLRLFGMVGTVAVEATHIVAGVRGGAKVALRVGLAVAPQTALAGFGARQIREADDFRFVAAARYVFRARTVAGFASVAVLLGGLKMGRAFKLLLVDVFMARQANVRTGVLRRIRRLAGFAFFGRQSG
jgi:hypothetical protein